jgi:hypothetical protein
MTDPIKTALNYAPLYEFAATNKVSFNELCTAVRAALEGLEKAEPVALVDHMVNRFLAWKLPADFHPDNGISFKRESDYDHPQFGRAKYEPIGTNLLTADQAKAMFAHCVEGYTHPAPVQAEPASEVEQLRQAQSNEVMPLIGPMLDAWDGLYNDFAQSDELRGLARAVKAINRAMLNAAPQPAAQVVGLTDAEIAQVFFKEFDTFGDLAFAKRVARAIEAAHGIKPPEKGGAA